MQPAPNQRNRTYLGLFALLLFLLGAPLAYASTGTISSTYKYAWSNIGGYVNFAPTQGGLSISDSGITGYAWSANDGWINFSPSQSSVKNDIHGNLSGFAWDSSAGWISFTGVTIDSSGQFHGEATGSNGYAINFDCTSCKVTTDWRPIPVVTSSPPTVVNNAPGSISPVFIPSPNNASSTGSHVVPPPTGITSNPPGVGVNPPSVGTITVSTTTIVTTTVIGNGSTATSTSSQIHKPTPAPKTGSTTPFFSRVNLQRALVPIFNFSLLSLFIAVIWFLL